MPNNHSHGSALTRAAAIIGLASLPVLSAAAASPQALDQASWRDIITQTKTAGQGCFQASYPSTVWRSVACTVAPQRPYIPRTGSRGHGGFTTGDGNDYAAVVKTLITSTTGTFPRIKNLTSETDGGQQNSYSLQINSQFFSSPACSGASNPSNCLGWEQFVYSSDSQAAFMQYWLINYANKCPAGWNTYSSDCYKNSASVRVPRQVISELGNLKLAGSTDGTTDTLTMTTATQAYKTTGPDTVVTLAQYWMESEFNIVGDGGGSEAVFNKGASLTAMIALKTSGTSAPVCQSNDGTTGETNNLNLGACRVKGGKTPSVKFVESN